MFRSLCGVCAPEGSVRSIQLIGNDMANASLQQACRTAMALPSSFGSCFSPRGGTLAASHKMRLLDRKELMRWGDMRGG
jgi:hypothetical protein